jgi:hypothetical protein
MHENPKVVQNIKSALDLNATALIAQLEERQTEDLEVACSIHAQGIPFVDSFNFGTTVVVKSLPKTCWCFKKCTNATSGMNWKVLQASTSSVETRMV